MSTIPDPQVSGNLIEEARKHIRLLFDEIARLSDQELTPAEYYGEFLKRVLMSLSAPAGAVWVRTPQGHLQLQYQINLKEAGLEESDANRQSHDELLRQVFKQGRPLYLPPHSSMGPTEGGGPSAGNPSGYLLMLAPIKVDQQTSGLVEVWQRPDHPPAAVPGFVQMLVRFAELASVYLRNYQLRTIMGQQQLWTQLEAFARQVHGSLHPTEVSYVVANEGRRLVECDRLSVAIRYGKRTFVEAISGADVVEKRSSLVQLMRALCDSVVAWGERLIYKGSRDETLPPNVVKALDEYLHESPSKLLAVLPLPDEREKESKRPARSVLVMESFEPSLPPEQLLARLDVVGKHATTALYNASEHRRIPMRWLWLPLARLQEGLGGKTRAIIASVAAAVAVLVLALFLVPYPLKMDSKGQLLPQVRQWVYSPLDNAQVVHFEEGVDTGKSVNFGQNLVLMRSQQLWTDMVKLQGEVASAQYQIRELERQARTPGITDSERLRFENDRQQKEFERSHKEDELNGLKQRTNAEGTQGYFWLKAPIQGMILNSEFKETLKNRFVKASDPLLRVGDQKQDWEVELKIPQKYIGQILQAYKTDKREEELEVDLLLISQPTRIFKGKLARGKIGGQATPNREDPNDAEPIVLASVYVSGHGIAAADAIPAHELLTGTEVHTKVRCGNHSMGYSLFYGLWEFFYEKVVFFF